MPTFRNTRQCDQGEAVARGEELYVRLYFNLNFVYLHHICSKNSSDSHVVPLNADLCYSSKAVG